jgi:hypothetical protein
MFVVQTISALWGGFYLTFPTAICSDLTPTVVNRAVANPEDVDARALLVPLGITAEDVDIYQEGEDAAGE